LLASDLKLALGFDPRAAGDEDGRVIGPANGEQRLDVPALAEGLDLRAPLHGAIEVVNLLAGVDEKAAGLADGVELGHVARERRRHRFVEPAHAFVDLSEIDERKSLKRVGEHFQIEEVELAGQRRRFDATLSSSKGDFASSWQPANRYGFSVDPPLVPEA
jgi:hypothetical protein